MKSRTQLLVKFTFFSVFRGIYIKIILETGRIMRPTHIYLAVFNIYREKVFFMELVLEKTARTDFKDLKNSISPRLFAFCWVYGQNYENGLALSP